MEGYAYGKVVIKRLRDSDRSRTEIHNVELYCCLLHRAYIKKNVQAFRKRGEIIECCAKLFSSVIRDTYEKCDVDFLIFLLDRK